MLGNNASRRYETRKANCLADHREATRNVEVGTKEHKNVSSIDRRTLEDASIQKAAISGNFWKKRKPTAKQGVPETVKDGKGRKEGERNEQTIKGIKDNKKRQAEPARHRERQTGRGPGEAGKAHVKTEKTKKRRKAKNGKNRKSAEK